MHIIIPARYASSRLPGKPLALLLGKPMIRHVAERALLAGPNVAVATDDERIARALAGLPVEVVMTDPGLPSGSDRVAAAAARMGLGDDEIVVNVQGDQPGIPAALITHTAAALDDPEVVMATPVLAQAGRRGEQNPHSVKVALNAKNDALYFSRAPIPWSRDDEPLTYYHHIGLYVFRHWLLKKFVSLPEGRLEQIEKLEQLRVLEAGYPIRCVLSQHSSPEVNVPEDIAPAEAALAAEGKKA